MPTPETCDEAYHDKLIAYGKDRCCPCCGDVINPDALISPNCKAKHKDLKNRFGDKNCRDCGCTL